MDEDNEFSHIRAELIEDAMAVLTHTRNELIERKISGYAPKEEYLALALAIASAHTEYSAIEFINMAFGPKPSPPSWTYSNLPKTSKEMMNPLYKNGNHCPPMRTR